jgi:class 3 adenylate cyclase
MIMESPRQIANSELGDLLWPDEAPSLWEPKLDALISKLQPLLARAGFPGDVLRAGRGGYELRLPDAWIDTEVASSKLAEAKTARDKDDMKKARYAAEVAADIAARAFLVGEEGPWVERQRERLKQTHDAAVEMLVEADEGVARPQRVLRTFMFTDIVESTKLVELVGDEAWTDLVRWHDQTLRGFFESHGGDEIDRAGDGFFVAFSDQASAIGCAIDVQHRLVEQRRSQGFAPQVRIGLHSAEVNTEGGLYHGQGVNIAARIAALAKGGQIVTSRATVEHLDETRLTDPRTVDLKGVSQPVEVVTLSWDD